MPMKRHILRLLAASLLLGACSEPLVDSAASGDEGGLALRVATSRNETDAAYDPMEHLVVRLYNAEGACCASTPRRTTYPHGWRCARATTASPSKRANALRPTS